MFYPKTIFIAGPVILVILLLLYCLFTCRFLLPCIALQSLRLVADVLIMYCPHLQICIVCTCLYCCQLFRTHVHLSVSALSQYNVLLTRTAASSRRTLHSDIRTGLTVISFAPSGCIRFFDSHRRRR